MAWNSLPVYTYLNVIPEYIALILTIVLWIYSRESYSVPTFKNKIFTWSIRIVAVANAASIATLHLTIDYTILPLPVTRILYDFFHLTAPFVPILFCWYVMAVIWEERDDLGPWMLRSLIPYMSYVVLLLVNHPTGIIFTVRAGEGYQYGPIFFIPYLMGYLYILLTLVLILIGRSRLSRQVMSVLLTFPLLMLVLIVVQQFFPSLVLVGSASAISLLILYLNLQNKQLVMDDLTGLPRRKAFLKTLELRISREQDAAVIMVSLNDFKQVNDKFGELFGDQFLQAIAAFLRESFPGCPIYRFSGDEFVILLQQPSRNVLESALDKIAARFSSPWHLEKRIWKLSASIAVVEYPRDATTVKDMITQLEYCIDEARRQGKGRTVRADENTFNQLKRRSQILEIMRAALDQDGFELHYQPVYCLNERRYVTAEALLRLHDHELGWISPGEMIPLAEESGLIIEIGYSVLNQVCRFIKRLDQENIRLDGIAVNFSAIQFAQEDFVESVLGIIHNHQVPAGRVHVEITESLFIGQFERAKNLMLQLNEHGISFSLDDFGTGYSNLVNVVELPFSYVKFDKRFLRNAQINSKSLSVMAGMASAFHAVGSKIVIEGVETSEQQSLAIQIGSDQIQGYLYAKPMPPDVFIDFVRQIRYEDDIKLNT